MSVFLRGPFSAEKVRPYVRTDSLVELEDELQDEFFRLFPRVGAMGMEDPARSWVIGSMCNLAKCAFGAYRTPEADGFVEHTIENTTMKHLNRNWMQRNMAGVLKIEVKEVRNTNNNENFLHTCCQSPYIIFTTGDTLVKSEIFSDSSNPIQNPIHYLCLRKRHLEAHNGATLGVRLYAKPRGGWKSIINAFRKDAHLGRADLKIDQFRTPEIHELEVPLIGGPSVHNTVVRFSVQLISVDTALNEMNKDESSNAWSETSENFEDELQWPELAQMTDIGHIEIEPVAFIDAPSTGTQAWIHVNMHSKIVFVAFRGTETNEFKDLVTDARVLPAQISPAMCSDRYALKPTKTLLDRRIKLHTGFKNAYESVRESVLRMVYDITGWNDSWTVCTTGHSLGGALATICAFELRNRRLTTAPSLQQNFSLMRAMSSFFLRTTRNEDPELRLGPKVAMVNFGAPCVGNKVFAQLYNETVRLSLRMFTEGDPIVKILPFYYTHVNHQILIQPDGEVHISGKSFQLGRNSEIQRRVLKSLECYEDLKVTDREASGSSVRNHLQPQYFSNLKATVEQFFARDRELRGHPMRVLRTRELSTIQSIPSLLSQPSVPAPPCASTCQ